MPEIQHLVPGQPHRHQAQPGPRHPQPGTHGGVPPAVPRVQAYQLTGAYPPDASELVNTVTKLAAGSLSQSSQNAYSRSWSLFHEFADRYNLIQTMPIWPDNMAMFVAYLFNRGLSASSIRTHLSALAYSHRMAGYLSPTDSFLISKMLRGAANISPRTDLRFPITLPILISLLNIVPSLAPSKYHASLFAAMFSTAFYGFLRCGEMCQSPNNLQFHQLFVSQTPSYAEIIFTKFKHNVSNKPFITRINSTPENCPVRVLQQYLKCRGPQVGPLFCLADATPISRFTFTKFLKSCLQLLRLPCEHYKSHSFRIGAATHALLLGKSEPEIQVLGRWSSPTFRKYIRVAAVSLV